MVSQDRPWMDKDLLNELYHEKEYSTSEIAEKWDCSQSTVSTWLKKHGLGTRTIQESHLLRFGNYAKFRTGVRGYERWRSQKKPLLVHRLLMVAEHGFNAVAGKQVHHKNGIPWDNRPENLELLSRVEHRRKHLKIDGIDRIRVAELYEHGECGSRKVGDLFDTSNNTVLRIHDEFY